MKSFKTLLHGSIFTSAYNTDLSILKDSDSQLGASITLQWISEVGYVKIYFKILEKEKEKNTNRITNCCDADLYYEL